MSKLSLYRQFAEKYSGGCGAGICKGASHIVLARGKIPCQVLFVGEAPGESEDALGKPFVGPAGKLLDRIIERAWTIYTARMQIENAAPPTFALTNLVCCIPRKFDKQTEKWSKAIEPDDPSIRQCQPRLAEFIQLCDGASQRLRLIVAVGRLARDYLDQEYRFACKLHRSIPIIDILHPSAILQANVTQQGLEVQRAVIRLSQALEDHVHG